METISEEKNSRSKRIQRAMTLYAVTDRHWLKEGETLEEKVREAIEGGVTCVQLREKHLKGAELEDLAIRVRDVCRENGIPFIIDDDIFLAKKIEADGVHVGQKDMEAKEARKLLGSDKILGVTAHNRDEAVRAEQAGADYLGSGAAFPTGSKDDVAPIDHGEYRRICEAVEIPVIAIGGISEENAPQLAGYGLSGIAVIHALFGQEDVREAAKRLLRITQAPEFKKCNYLWC